MRALIITITLALAVVAGEAAAQCISNLITRADGSTVFCTTCCYGGNCTTICN